MTEKNVDSRIVGLLAQADDWHDKLGDNIHDHLAENLFSAAATISDEVVSRKKSSGWDFDRIADRWLTSPWVGFPIMIGVLAVVFWLTITGANIPSAFLSGLLMEEGGLTKWFALFLPGWNCPGFLQTSLFTYGHQLMKMMHAPWWVEGFLLDGVYLCWAWVFSVMLPPMAIFFPLFTFLEDLGFLPRVAFNLDRFFRLVGGHGKQSLCMAMGFGCNAAGVIACRIIESPRERVIAILTNTFVPCNGRWPTLILMSSLFLATAAPPGWATMVSVATLVSVTLLGVLATLFLSWVLSRSLLKGLPSVFILELPPYRPPQLGRIMYTSIIDRTWFVLKRAMICAAPAGAVIWLLGAIPVGETSLFQYLAQWLDPIGRALGLDGIILLAFLFAVPANEIVIPTILMGYMNLAHMTSIDDPSAILRQHGWTELTAVCLMLFSLLHFPCTTTTLTVWAETRNVKWTFLSNLLPGLLAVFVCFLVAQTSRWLGVL